MRIVADRHLNLHSESVDGGLVHVPRKQVKIVPEDVQEHPAFKLLVKHGTIHILAQNDPKELELEDSERESEEPEDEEEEKSEPEE
jgi:hypothetical protein